MTVATMLSLVPGIRLVENDYLAVEQIVFGVAGPTPLTVFWGSQWGEAPGEPTLFDWRADDHYIFCAAAGASLAMEAVPAVVANVVSCLSRLGRVVTTPKLVHDLCEALTWIWFLWPEYFPGPTSDPRDADDQ